MADCNEYLEGFYSKLVRLKARTARLMLMKLTLFLFQIGSIKRSVKFRLALLAQVFLFQIGSIKRLRRNRSCNVSRAFLFQIGSIKRITTQTLHRAIGICFYSKLVRLKAELRAIVERILLSFLFQIGSIKSIASSVIGGAWTWFLFQIGSIKSPQ